MIHFFAGLLIAGVIASAVNRSLRQDNVFMQGHIAREYQTHKELIERHAALLKINEGNEQTIAELKAKIKRRK